MIVIVEKITIRLSQSVLACQAEPAKDGIL